MQSRTVKFRLLVVGWLLCSSVACIEANAVDSGDEPGDRITLGYGFGIWLSGNPYQVMRFKRWLDSIVNVPKGLETVWAISRSRHRLNIEHSMYSVISSGRTLALMTRNLTNGVGEDVTIKFNAHIPDSGSHRVFDTRTRPIEFTAVQNLYHELAHAMHIMTGTWQYFRSEQSAIEEENVFRRELAIAENKPFHERVRVQGEAVCPGQRARLVAWAGQELICKFN